MRAECSSIGIDHHWPAFLFAPGGPREFACQLTVFEPHWLSLFCAPSEPQKFACRPIEFLCSFTNIVTCLEITRPTKALRFGPAIRGRFSKRYKTGQKSNETLCWSISSPNRRSAISINGKFITTNWLNFIVIHLSKSPVGCCLWWSLLAVIVLRAE